MNPADITVITAIDEKYLDKFLAVWRTWRLLKPEINEMHLIVMYDAEGLPVPPREIREQKAEYISQHLEHSNYSRTILSVEMTMPIAHGFGCVPPAASIRMFPWTMPEAKTQREKMLTSLVFGVEHVQTPWYLKLDADTVATDKRPWIDDSWFQEKNGVLPAFITNPWGYTKPAAFLDQLDDWGDETPGMKEFPRLNIPHAPGSKRAYHERIISWLFFGNTAWTKQMLSLLPSKKLPVPSQDTFLWYCAKRTAQYYVTARMKKRGWDHKGRHSAEDIAAFCKEVLA